MANKKMGDLSGNLDLGFNIKKKKFTVNGDPNLTVEFDPSDLGVTSRLSKAMPKFVELNEKWKELNNTVEQLTGDVEDDEKTLKSTEKYAKQFDEIEVEIRTIIDDVFDSKLADTLLGNSSSFSPVNGYFKYEHIITALLKCYEQHIQDEAPKFNSREVRRYTNKYIKK